jgi:hypothetical protein
LTPPLFFPTVSNSSDSPQNFGFASASKSVSDATQDVTALSKLYPERSIAEIFQEEVERQQPWLNQQFWRSAKRKNRARNCNAVKPERKRKRRKTVNIRTRNIETKTKDRFQGEMKKRKNVLKKWTDEPP